MTAWRWRLAAMGIVLVAAASRMYAPAWDGGFALHPDERFLIGVAESTPLWGDPCRAAADFPYGTLPLYALRPLLAFAPNADPLLAARLLAALVGTALVAAAMGWGRLLAGRGGALLAGGLMAVAPFPIQQGHFYTVDPWAALFASLAMLFTCRRRWGASGVMLAWALASKVSLVWALPVPLLMAARRGWPALRRYAAALLIGFAVADPALLLHLHCWRGPLVQAGMAAGRYLFPYTEQYLGTWPWLYPLWQMGLWGLGLPAALLGAGGWGWAGLKGRGWPRWAAWWTAGGFLATGVLFVKFPRYLLPLYPAWTGWVAWLLLRRCARRWRYWLLVPTLVVALLEGGAQLALYDAPHPWITASRWLCAALLPGDKVAVERWDHPLPLPLPACEGRSIDFVPFSPHRSEDRRAALEASVIVIASRRNYGAAVREDDLRRQYARLLDRREVRIFARCPHLGPLALTDDPLRDAGLDPPLPLAERCGRRWAWRLPRLDESFRVYDAPLTLVIVP